MKHKFSIASYAIIFSALVLSAVEGCASAEPTPTAPRPTASRSAISAPLAPTATIQLGSASAPTSSSPYAMYDDKAAPFTIQYPRGWNLREEPESILFTVPDETAALQIIFYEYLEGAPRNLTAKDVLNNFSQNFSLGTGLKLTQQVTNADASISAITEYTDASKRAQQGLVRVTIAKSKRYHFIVLFSANRDQFARYKPIGTTVVESFRER